MAETLQLQLKTYMIAQELKEKMYRDGDYPLVPLVSMIRLTTQVPTMATDSKEILINPEYFEKLTGDERYAVFMHEICHIKLNHHNMPFKLEPDYDHEFANVAMDIVINELLERNGLHLPKGAQRRASNIVKAPVPPEYETSREIYQWFKKELPQHIPGEQPGPNFKGNIVYDKVTKQWGTITTDTDGTGILAYDPISEEEAIQRLGYTPKVARKVKAESVATEAQVTSPNYTIYMPMQQTGGGEKGPKMFVPSSVKFPPVKKGQQGGQSGQQGGQSGQQGGQSGQQGGQSGQDDDDDGSGQSGQSRQSGQSGDDEKSRDYEKSGQAGQSGKDGDDGQDEGSGQSGHGGQDDDDYDDDGSGQDDDDDDDDDDGKPTLKDVLDKSSELARKLRNAEVKNPIPLYTPTKDFSIGLVQILEKIFKDVGSQFRTDRELTYARPNRRQQSYPAYQPIKGYGRENKSVPRLIIYVDVSGSMSDRSVQTILSEIQYNLHTLRDAKVRIKAFATHVVEIPNISDKSIYSYQGIELIRNSTDANDTNIPTCIADVEKEAKNAEHVLFITDLDNMNKTLKLFNAIQVPTTIVTDQVGFNCTNRLVKVYEGIKFGGR